MVIRDHGEDRQMGVDGETKKGRPFLYIVLLAVAGIIFGNLLGSWIFFIGTICSVAILVVAVGSLPPKNLHIEVERGSRHEAREVHVEGELRLKIKIKNKGDEIRFLEVHDVLPPRIEVSEGTNHHICTIKANDVFEFDYKIKCPVTGNFEVGPIKLRYRDGLCLFSRVLEPRKKIDLQVLPKTEDMEKVSIAPSYTKHWLGDTKSKNIGFGSEFFALREYHPGDGLKDINWKATARYLDPKTNAYEGEKSGDVILVVDGYQEGMIGTMEHNTMKASIDATASLASVLLSSRHRVGLIVSGSYLNWLYPSTGKNHYHRIIANLTKFEEGGGWGMEGVKWILEDLFPRKSMIIFISPLTVSKFSETMIDLCMREYDVMVISPDPLKIEMDLTDNYEGLAEKLHHAERQHLLDKLWTHGAIVVDWDPREPLEPTLEEVLRYKRR